MFDQVGSPCVSANLRSLEVKARNWYKHFQEENNYVLGSGCYLCLMTILYFSTGVQNSCSELSFENRKKSSMQMTGQP